MGKSGLAGRVILRQKPLLVDPENADTIRKLRAKRKRCNVKPERNRIQIVTDLTQLTRSLPKTCKSFTHRTLNERRNRTTLNPNFLNMSDFYRWPHRALMRVRQTVGWASTIDAKSLLALRIDNNDPSMRLMPKPMRPGWYMLEVMASQLTLGSNLTLVQGPSTHSLALMQPGPNKRVVHLTSKDTLRLHLDSPWELINGSSLTLSRISNRFAQSRQIQKIKNNANCAAPGFRAHVY